LSPEFNIPILNMNTIPQSSNHARPGLKFGVAEWAEASVNIGTGCSHNCRYCYACSNAVWRKQIPSRADWTNERLKTVQPKARKYTGRVMFPTTHDISPFYLEPAIVTLRRLLEQGNRVLIVSKPHLVWIQRLCREFEQFKSKILFRFSIGSLDETLAAFWEPCAPAIQERIECLKFAYTVGFSTSVSMEPMLAGRADAIQTFQALIPFVTEKIWIGKMNNVAQRVDQRDVTVRRRCCQISDLQCDCEIMGLVWALNSHPQVEWKESIKEIIVLNSLR
jgi:DNA repair photolyase